MSGRHDAEAVLFSGLVGLLAGLLVFGALTMLFALCGGCASPLASVDGGPTPDAEAPRDAGPDAAPVLDEGLDAPEPPDAGVDACTDCNAGELDAGAAPDAAPDAGPVDDCDPVRSYMVDGLHGGCGAAPWSTSSTCRRTLIDGGPDNLETGPARCQAHGDVGFGGSCAAAGGDCQYGLFCDPAGRCVSYCDAATLETSRGAPCRYPCDVVGGVAYCGAL